MNRPLHGAAHQLTMALRALRGRLGSRRRVRGRGNVIAAGGAVLRGVSIEIDGDANRIEILPNARLRDVTITMEGDGHRLHIGSHVWVGAGAFRFYDRNGTILIGERTTIYDAGFGVTEGGTISVGEDCLFSIEVDVRNGDSHSVVDAQTRARLNPAADVVIGDHVWVSQRVLILKGSRIGRGSVVAAGALVAGELPAGSISAGVPARPVRTGIDWIRERVPLS
jgi:acetyltransferase-like isoleucine patch superfamily enzyme